MKRNYRIVYDFLTNIAFHLISSHRNNKIKWLSCNFPRIMNKIHTKVSKITETYLYLLRLFEAIGKICTAWIQLLWMWWNKLPGSHSNSFSPFRISSFNNFPKNWMQIMHCQHRMQVSASKYSKVFFFFFTYSLVKTRYWLGKDNIITWMNLINNINYAMTLRVFRT